jgi:hypothetical protein
MIQWAPLSENILYCDGSDFLVSPACDFQVQAAVKFPHEQRGFPFLYAMVALCICLIHKSALAAIFPDLFDP